MPAEKKSDNSFFWVLGLLGLALFLRYQTGGGGILPDGGDPPFETTGCRAIVIYNASTSGTLPQEQQNVIHSVLLRQKLRENTPDSFRTVDADSITPELLASITPEWLGAYSLKPPEIPWFAISNGNDGWQGPLKDVTLQKALDLADKYKVPK